MGRKITINTLIFIVFLLVKLNAFSQTKISGVVFEESKNGLVGASIIVKDSLVNRIIDYTFTNSKGFYKLNIKEKGVYVFTFSSLGFKPKRVSIKITSTSKEIKLNTILIEKTLELNEVIVQAEKIYGY